MRATQRADTAYISGEIVPDEHAHYYEIFGWDCTSPKGILAALQSADGRPFTFLVDSPGGYMNAAAAIYEAIMAYEGKVTFEISTAHSAASLISMASAKEGNKSRMSPLGLMGVHNAQGYAEGDYRDMEQAGQHLQAATQVVVNAYKQKTGMKEEEIRELLDNSKMFTAQEALAMGMVDEIMHQEGENGVEFTPEQQALIKGRMTDMLNYMPRPTLHMMQQLQNAVHEEKQEEPQKADAETAAAFLNLEKIRFGGRIDA